MDKVVVLLVGVFTVCCIWPANSQIETNMDLTWMLSGVKNYTDLCEFMPYDDCQKLIDEMNFVEQSGDKVAVSGSGPQIARFDACNPRPQTIAIPRHHNPEIIIWPPCTRARRCGGCCTSDVFSCEPTETVDKYVKVFDTKLAYPGAHRFSFVGIRNVRVVEHTQCDAQCKTKPHECHKYQEYKHRKCRCECKPERMKLKATCHANQRWDDSECDCICPNRATTKCPPPFRFSTTTCKCTMKTEVTGEIDLDVLIEQSLLNLNNIRQDNYQDHFDLASLFRLTGDGNDPEGRESYISNDDPAMNGVEITTPEDIPEVSTTDSTTSTTEPTTTTTLTTTTTTPKPTTTKKPKPACMKTLVCRPGWAPTHLKSGKCICIPAKFAPKKGSLRRKFPFG